MQSTHYKDLLGYVYTYEYRHSVGETCTKDTDKRDCSYAYVSNTKYSCRMVKWRVKSSGQDDSGLDRLGREITEPSTRTYIR